MRSKSYGSAGSHIHIPGTQSRVNWRELKLTKFSTRRDTLVLNISMNPRAICRLPISRHYNGVSPKKTQTLRNTPETYLRDKVQGREAHRRCGALWSLHISHNFTRSPRATEDRDSDMKNCHALDISEEISELERLQVAGREYSNQQKTLAYVALRRQVFFPDLNILLNP